MPETMTVFYCGEEFTLRRESEGYFVADPDAPCVVKSIRIDGDRVTMELNIATCPDGEVPRSEVSLDSLYTPEEQRALDAMYEQKKGVVGALKL